MPAAATKRMSCWLALLITSSSAFENGPPPQLLERTRTLTPPIFACTAKSMASMASAVVPEPLAPMNFRAMSDTSQLTPATPTPLLPTAPIVPATCVP